MKDYEKMWNDLKKLLLDRHATYSAKALEDDFGVYATAVKAIDTTLLQMADLEVK